MSARGRLSRIASHLSRSDTAAGTPLLPSTQPHPPASPTPSISYTTLSTPSGKVYEFSNHFLRENLTEVWNRDSLQRLQYNLWSNNGIVETECLSEVAWRIRFDDGTVGHFHLPLAPVCTTSAVDLETQPRMVWGKHECESVRAKLSKPYREGGMRFDWNDFGLSNVDGDNNRAAEQLGGSRSRLTQTAAKTRSALIEAAHKYGIAIIENAPCIPDQCVLFGDRVVGAVEATSFGYKFVIKSVPNPHNLAFASMHLQHHTDLAYCRKCPDIGLFHCLNNADRGGDSVWLDGFACAEELRRTNPAAFDLLTKVKVRHMDITDKWDLQASHPTIELDSSSGEIKRVYFNERTRDSWRAWGESSNDPQCSSEFYDAIKCFEKIIEDTRFHITTPLKPGEIAVFDNGRVLHSRTEFEGSRHMEGTYLEWGSLYGAWRNLKTQSSEHEQKEIYCGITVGEGSSQ